MERKRISSGSSFEEKMAYSRAIVAGNWVFVSGTTGYNYATMEINPDVVEQANQCFLNIEKALKEAGSGLEDIVRVHYILPNVADFEPCWPILQKYLGTIKPAATMFSAQLANPIMKIEIEVTALKTDK